MEVSFADIPISYIDQFKETMGVVYYLNDKLVSNTTSIIILIGSAVVFFLLGIVLISRKKK